jgi:hypothetical protein
MKGTPVIFRKWPENEGGDVIALFPTLLGTMDPYTCSSYERVGQHGAADPWEVITRTKSAKPDEYADLKEELEKSVGYDDLVVYQRLQSSFLEERRRTLQETYSSPVLPPMLVRETAVKAPARPRKVAKKRTPRASVRSLGR